jgi:lipopolysaccharide export LptBFGC system permease protein LptF
MNEIVDMILTFLFWYAIGWFLFNFLVRPWAQSRLEERIRELDQEIEDIKRVYKRVKIEQYGDTFYLFNADTDEFIAQGRTMQEIQDRVREDIVLNIMEGDPDVVQRFQQTFPRTA